MCMAGVRAILFALTLTARAASAIRGAPLRARVVPRSRQLCLDENKNAVAEKTSGGVLPFFQQKIPEDQQPIMELQGLRRQAFMDWPEDDGYQGRIRGFYTNTMLFLARRSLLRHLISCQKSFRSY